MRLLIVILPALLLTACADPLLTNGRALVQQQLRDPSSAEFRNLAESTRQPGTVCGEVNAANGFGGKTGFVTFDASPVKISDRITGSVFIDSPIADAGQRRAHHYRCRDVLPAIPPELAR